MSCRYNLLILGIKMDILKKAGNLIRGAASLMVGIPAALVATVVLGSAACILKGMDLCWSHVKKNIFKTKIYYDPFLHNAAASAFGALGKFWSGFGVWGFAQVIRGVHDQGAKIGSFAQDHNAFDRTNPYISGSRGHEQYAPLLEEEPQQDQGVGLSNPQGASLVGQQKGQSHGNNVP